jgi:NADPH2:quinone reductase
VAVDAAGLLDVPEGLALDEAVALLADGRTATMLVDAAGVRAGDRVLVEAAAGGVGTLLVQLARGAGATVIAAAGGARKVALARELGAAVAVDYRDEGWQAAVRAATGGVDVVLDGVGGAISRAALGLLEPGGRMLSYGLASGQWSDVTDEEAQARGARLVRLERPAPEQARAFTRRALEAGAAGRLRPVIGQRFALEDAAAAHAAIEARATVGKTLLEVR